MMSQTPGDTSPEQPGEFSPPAPDSWSQPTPDSWAPLSAPGATYPAAAQPPSGQIPPTTYASDPYASGRFAPGQDQPGQYQPGPFTPAQYPPGQYPPGQYPPGQYPPGQYPPGPYGYPQQFFAPVAPRNNPFAVTALVLGLTQILLLLTVFGNILCAIPAIVFGSIALRQIGERGERGRGMAIAGLVLGIGGVLIFLLILVGAIAAGIYGGAGPS
jgi:hypothetical protein